MPTKINKEKLLLVEGKDERFFFEALLQNLEIEDVQIINIAGKDNLKITFPTLINSDGFSDVKYYMIIQDADNDSKARFNSIQSLLSKHDQPIPKKCAEWKEENGVLVGIYIMPGNQTKGMLENLCLDTVKNHPILQCVDQYCSCLEEKLENKLDSDAKKEGKYYFPNNLAKARMHSFLAGQNKFVPSLGIAAKKGYFNLKSEVLSELRNFLVMLKN